MLTTAFEPDYLCPAYLPDKFKQEIKKSKFFDDNHEQFVLEATSAINPELILCQISTIYKIFEHFCKSS